MSWSLVGVKGLREQLSFSEDNSAKPYLGSNQDFFHLSPKI